jgi:peptide alpha-N-acetyltransferase
MAELASHVAGLSLEASTSSGGNNSNNSSNRNSNSSSDVTTADNVAYIDYKDESMLPDIQRLIAADLSEPYSIFTYRYFLHQWPSLCICAFARQENGEVGEMIGTIVCKAEDHRDVFQGYIAMLTVNKQYRKLGIGKKVSEMVCFGSK